MIDIRTLFSQSGHFTFDPGFTATGSCTSAITYIDGGAGKLTYRGYKIEDLAEKSSFMEVCYLLLYGDLPSRIDLVKFEETVKNEMLCHERLKHMFNGFKEDDPPMAIMCSIIGSLSTFLVDKDQGEWN
jgi:citrate synthase